VSRYAAQGDHVLSPETFSAAMLSRQCLEILDHRAVMSEGRVGIHALLQCRQPKLDTTPNFVFGVLPVR
jgi:hypothetical protein